MASGGARDDEKVCPTCGRPFSWRKKWEGVWDQVKYCGERCRRNREGDAELRDAIRSKLAERAPNSSICPSDAARALGSKGWRERMPQVRAEARRLAERGEVRATQGDREVDALRARGPIRLRRGAAFGASDEG